MSLRNNVTLLLSALFACNCVGLGFSSRSSQTLRTAQYALTGTTGHPIGLYELTDWIVPADCPSGQPCDLFGAFQRAQADCLIHPPITGYDADYVGCKYTVNPGTYRLSATVKFCRQETVVGSGRSLTRILTSSTAFDAVSVHQCLMANAGHGGSPTISDLAIWYAGTSTNTVFGVLASGWVDLERLEINYYTQGVRIYADHQIGSNANLWRMSDVAVGFSKHSGIYIHGGDANAGTAIGLNVHSNCASGDSWKASLGPCANLQDDAFLGNYFLGVHSAGCADTVTGTTFPAYLFTNESQRSLCFGCYSESGQVPAYISQYTIAMGGTAGSGWTGPGLRVEGTSFSGGTFVNAVDPNNVVAFELGTSTGVPGQFWAARAYSSQAGVWPLRFKWEPYYGAYRFDVGGLDDQVALRIIGQPNMAYPAGTMMAAPKP